VPRKKGGRDEKGFFFTALLMSAIAASCVFAMSADEIMNKSNIVNYYSGNDGKAQVKMFITDSQGRQRKRIFSILRKNIEKGGEQKFYVYFKEPTDVEGMVYMVWKHPGKDDDRWLYMPALDLVKRIAATDKRSSFVGSDFVYEDVSGRLPEEDNHEIQSEGEDFYIIKSTPKDPKMVEFSYYISYISKENFLPVKVEYYNKEEALSRVVETMNVKEIQGYPTIVNYRAKNLETGSETVMNFTDMKYDIGLPDDVFTERYLRRPARKWLD